MNLPIFVGGNSMRSVRLLFVALISLCSLLAAQSNPVPYVNSPLVPTTVAPGATGFTLSVNGTGFVSGATVNWNGSPRATTFVSSSALQAAILSSDVASVGTAAVTVTNPAPGGGVSNIANFSITLPEPSVGFSSTTTLESKNCNRTVLYPQLVADINGDGKPDVVGTVCSQGYIYVAFGNGDGTFQAPIYTTIVPPSNYGMAAADFNADGKMDLAIINAENNVAVLLGNGDGTFQTAKNFLTGVQPTAISVADFNGDGKLDILVPADNNNALDVLLGNGDGTFQPYLASPTGGVYPIQAAVGDFNGDGKLDAAVIEVQSSEVTIMLGNGDGTFRFGNQNFTSLYSMTAVDLNGDGKLDLIGTGTATGAVSGIVALFGNGDGTFQTPVQVADGNYQYMGIADLNGDGKPDIWAVVSQSDSLSLLLGNGNGTFQTAFLSPMSSTGSLNSLIVGDFNQDGKPDFLGNYGGCTSDEYCTTLALQSPAVASPSAIVFPTQLVKVRSQAQTVTLYNSGVNAVNISSITLAGTDYKDFFEANSCPAALASATSCVIHVGFDPSVSYSTETAYLSIVDDALGGGQQVQLSGIGTYIKESPKTLNFGNVTIGQSATLTVTLTNTSNSSEQINRILVKPNADAKEFKETNNCGGSMAAGAQCTVTVVFTPTATGRQASQLEFEFYYDDPPLVQMIGTGD
jgi:hypothetical protein